MVALAGRDYKVGRTELYTGAGSAARSSGARWLCAFVPLSSHSFPARATSSLVADSLICRRASTRLGEEGAGAAGWAELDTSTLARQALIRLQFCMARTGAAPPRKPPTDAWRLAGGRALHVRGRRRPVTGGGPGEILGLVRGDAGPTRLALRYVCMTIRRETRDSRVRWWGACWIVMKIASEAGAEGLSGTFISMYVIQGVVQL